MKLAIKIFFLFLLFASCSSNTEIIEPPIDLTNFVIQDNFKIELVASEPLLNAPVAMTFDNQGRIWAMEMSDYMPNIHGSDEDIPTSRIIILEDQNGNGRMDKVKVFMDKLSQPRAMALVYGGLLYAEAPNLFFVEIENDKPVNRVLVDSVYAVGGNVEHQPNGLVMNLDNWIYNAKCNYRYRRINGEWKKESTHFRGQWGMSHDDYGRLFYNDNSNFLYGDVVMPNLMTRNKYLHPKEGVGKNICLDRKVYPLHATSVNRGYTPGLLDENNKLTTLTSGCSPLIYRGNEFETAYQNNAFVCSPDANAVKRIILNEEETNLTGVHAWNDKEFLASTDEGFRPVNLNNAPDGSIYITDMHRGIIQHKVYMTAYLKKQIEDKQLDTIYNAGRIFRVFQKDIQKENSDLPFQQAGLDKMSNEELCNLLKNKNGWFRDRAQQILIYKNAKDVVAKLEEIASDHSNHLAQLHALWTLEGLDELDENVLLQIKKDAHPKVANTAIRFLTNKNPWNTYERFFQQKNKEIDLQLALSTSQHSDVEKSFPFLKKINTRYPDDNLFAEAIVSGLAGKEELFLKEIKKDGSSLLKNKLEEVIKNIQADKVNAIYTRVELWRDDKDLGRDLFNIHCAACHGMGGEGIANLAPSLLDADLVEENPEVVANIILHGLQGEIHVNGKPENFAAAMPGVRDNPAIKDEDIAAITHYVKNAFSMSPQGVKVEKVAELRNQKPKEGNLFTEKELLSMYKKE